MIASALTNLTTTGGTICSARGSCANNTLLCADFTPQNLGISGKNMLTNMARSTMTRAMKFLRPVLFRICADGRESLVVADSPEVAKRGVGALGTARADIVPAAVVTGPVVTFDDVECWKSGHLLTG